MNKKAIESLFLELAKNPSQTGQKVSEDELRLAREALAQIDLYDKQQTRAIADVVVKKLREEIRAEDMSPLFSDVTVFGVNETPEYQYQKGLKAYVHEPGSSAPRSTITQRTVTLETERVSVHPEFELSQIEGGRFGPLSGIKTLAKQELLGHRNATLWNVLINSVPGTAALGTNLLSWADTASVGVKKNLLVSGIDYADDRAVNGIQAIVGRRSILGFIMDLDGYSDAFKELVDRGGNSPAGVMLGAFRGIPVVALHQYTDGYDQNRIDSDNIMIVANGTTKLAVTEEAKALEDIDIDETMWHWHIWEKYGAAVLWSDRNVRINVT